MKRIVVIIKHEDDTDIFLIDKKINTYGSVEPEVSGLWALMSMGMGRFLYENTVNRWNVEVVFRPEVFGGRNHRHGLFNMFIIYQHQLL